MKRSGTSIIFLNDAGQVLLLLRDDNPAIPYPNMWDLPGGHVEPDETPQECIVREMREEMGLELTDFEPASVMAFSDRFEHTFWTRANLKIDDIDLTEGQRLQWFSREEIRQTELAYGFNLILEDFFTRFRGTA